MLIALSGGVDSSYLLHAAKGCGADVRPYFVKTAFQPVTELLDAKRAADAAGVSLGVLYEDVLAEPEICANGADRCYHCKRFMFEKLISAAKAEGIETVIDGTNASDDADDRPGMRALAELNVRSPLRECGLGKADTRRAAEELGLHNWRKPPYSCLATRIMPGVTITAEGLAKAENAEKFLSGLGFSDFRVRLYHGAARIQVTQAQTERLIAMRGEILAGLSEFDAVMLDLQPREESV